MRLHLAATLATILLVWNGSDTASAQERAEFGLYEYRAAIRPAVDGDTVDADVDLGLNVWLRNDLEPAYSKCDELHIGVVNVRTW